MSPGASLLAGLWRLGELPDWLRPERLKPAIERSIPEFASGALALRDVRPKRIHLKNGVHGGTFKLAVGGPGEEGRVVSLLGRHDPDGARREAAAGRFAESGWRGALPDLGLVLETPSAADLLPAQDLLTDPGRARDFLEGAIRAGSWRLRELQIARCTPRVARHNPGSRITVVCELEYADADAPRGWPRVVVAKTHRGDKGRIAYESMSALWRSPLGSGHVVTLAEPLAYVAEDRVLVQSGVPGDETLADRIENVVLHGEGTHAALHGRLAHAARGLAALHQTDVRAEPYGWEHEMVEVRERIARLSAWIPGFEAALAPALAHLEALAEEHPADRPAPSHRSFRPAQVLLAGEAIAFIDFDGFAEAEPAVDLALFKASLKQNALRAAERELGAELPPERLHELLYELETLARGFVYEYARHRPVSLERIDLWETLYLLENLLNTWEKVRPQHLRSSMALFERHLRQSGLALL